MTFNLSWPLADVACDRSQINANMTNVGSIVSTRAQGRWPLQDSGSRLIPNLLPGFRPSYTWLSRDNESEVPCQRHVTATEAIDILERTLSALFLEWQRWLVSTPLRRFKLKVNG